MNAPLVSCGSRGRSGSPDCFEGVREKNLPYMMKIINVHETQCEKCRREICRTWEKCSGRSNCFEKIRKESDCKEIKGF